MFCCNGYSHVLPKIPKFTKRRLSNHNSGMGPEVTLFPNLKMNIDIKFELSAFIELRHERKTHFSGRKNYFTELKIKYVKFQNSTFMKIKI